ncbi:MAG: DUF6702 family protein [Cyclobacteriaceae bacterium]
MTSSYCWTISWMLWLAAHPFFISLTDMVYNPENERIEIAQKIFWDDLEVALSNAIGSPVDFLDPADPAQMEKIIETYLLQKNKIKINGKQVKLEYLGHEIEEDAAWFYMETEPVDLPKKITITNELLFDDFPTQQNIVNFYMDRKPRSLITHKSKIEGVLIIEE